MSDIFLIIAEQALLHIPLIIGAYISISLMKIPDLSLESAYLFGALCGAQALMLSNTLPLAIILLIVMTASLCGGAIVGMVSGVIAQYGRIPYLLAAIMTIGLFHGIAYLFSNGYQSLAGFNNPLLIFPSLVNHPELLAVLLIALIIIAAGAILLHRQLGYALAVYGNNPRFFEHYGISTNYVALMGLMLSNALAGCSGYLFAQSNGFVEIHMGASKILLCITSLILGKLFFKKNIFSIGVPISGTFSYFALQQLLLKAGFNLKYFTFVQAIIILCILLIFFRKNNTTKKIDHLGV